MRYRVELRRVRLDDTSSMRDATVCQSIDAIDAAQYARAMMADRYDEPESYWIVEAVTPLDPLPT